MMGQLQRSTLCGNPTTHTQHVQGHPTRRSAVELTGPYPIPAPEFLLLLPGMRQTISPQIRRRYLT